MRSIGGLLAVACLVTTSMASNPAPHATLPLEERVFVASKIYSLTQVFFTHWEGAPGLDLDAAYREYLSKVATTDDRHQFDIATLEFVAKLHNGHTDFWDPWVIDHYGWSQLFDAGYVDGQWVVTRSSIPDLKSGDIVASIDNQPFEQFFAESRKYLSGSNEAQLRRRFFSSNSPLPRRFLLKLADGRTVRVESERSNPTAVKTPEITEGRWICDGVLAYTKISSFDDPAFQKNAIEFVQKFHSSKVRKPSLSMCGETKAAVHPLISFAL
jgi:hypothetical protein